MSLVQPEATGRNDMNTSNSTCTICRPSGDIIDLLNPNIVLYRVEMPFVKGRPCGPTAQVILY